MSGMRGRPPALLQADQCFWAATAGCSVQTMRQIQGLHETASIFTRNGPGKAIYKLKKAHLSAHVGDLSDDQLRQRLPPSLPDCSDSSLLHNMLFVQMFMNALCRSHTDRQQLQFSRKFILSEEAAGSAKAAAERKLAAQRTFQGTVQALRMMLDALACTLEGSKGFLVADQGYVPAARSVVEKVMEELGSEASVQITVLSDQNGRPRCRCEWSANRKAEHAHALQNATTNTASSKWFCELAGKAPRKSI